MEEMRIGYEDGMKFCDKECVHEVVFEMKDGNAVRMMLKMKEYDFNKELEMLGKMCEALDAVGVNYGWKEIKCIGQ